MNIKHNINYFKMSDLLAYIGAGCMLIGLPLFIFAPGILFWISAIIIPIGAVAFIVGVSVRSNDKDMDLTVKQQTEDLYEDLNENAKYVRRVVQRVPPFTIEGYEYEEGLHLRKAKSGVIRSSKFTKTFIYMLKDGVYIKSRTVSLIGEASKNKSTEISFDLLKDLELCKEEKEIVYRKKKFTIKAVRLYFRYVNGLTVSVPVGNEIRAQEAIERITHSLKMYNKAKEESSQK